MVNWRMSAKTFGTFRRKTKTAVIASLCSSWAAWLCRKHREHCTRTTCQTIIDLSVYLCIYLSVHLSIYSSIYLSLYLFVHLSIHPSIYLCVCLSILQNGKLRVMCEDIGHVPTRDSQCRTVQTVSLEVLWTDQKALWRNISTIAKICLPPNHSRISVHLLAEQNMMYWGWFWIFFANSGNFCGRRATLFGT